MNESDLQAKGYVQAPDGSWAKPKRDLGAGGPLVREPKMVEASQSVQFAPARPAKRIRQSRDKLNKLETEWLNICIQAYPENCRIVAQAVRFRLGNGIWYKPDVVVFGTKVYAYEVKGPHAFRGGFESLKVAAGLYPWIEWSLVWKEGYQWQEQEVLP